MTLSRIAGLVAFCLGISAFGGPLYTQCPAVGLNTGCAILITVNANGTTMVAGDPNSPNNGPYDGSDDTLVGVVNNSPNILTSLPLSGTGQTGAGLFDFESDGLCGPSISPQPAGCPFDSTGYGGPGVTFSNITTTPAGGAGNNNTGVVNFNPGVAANGGTAYFSLEDYLLPSQITPGGGTGGGTQTPEPASLAFALSGLTGFLTLGWVRRRSRRR
jgi:hypothetical protein